MSDTNSFINAYIDNSLGMIHENISTILQLKTQLRIINDTIAQKDATISQLMNQIEQLNDTNAEIFRLKEESSVLTEKNIALSNKVSHFDSLLAQVNEMKSMIKQRDEQIEKLEARLKAFTTKKKSSNSKKTIDTTVAASSKTEIDDF